MKETGFHPLRTARARRNLTIEQLSKVANVGTATIWRAEHYHPISAESRRRLCTYFSMTSQALGLIALSGDNEEAEWQTMPSEVPDTSPLPVQEDMASIAIPHRPSLQAEAGTWLVGEAGQLASLFEENWDLETVLKSLRIVLQSLQVLPDSLRHSLFHAGSTKVNRKPLTFDETQQLQQALDKSIYEAWQFYHESGSAQVLVVAQAQLCLLQRFDPLLAPEASARFQAAIRNLIGAALYDQGEYDAAQREYQHAYADAVRGKDIWHQVQSNNWLAVIANSNGRYINAIDFLEKALHQLDTTEGDLFPHTRAHLLANWAYNAGLLQDQAVVREKLSASKKVLDRFDYDNDPEFDIATWHQLAGKCVLMEGHYNTAIQHFEESLTRIPDQWHGRRALSLLPLAEAYAHKRDREATLAVAEQATHDIKSADSRMLKHRFQEYQQVLLSTFPHDRVVRSFVAQAVPLLRVEHKRRENE
jgi:tetratricopeptide (TPR) repeat protein